MEVLNKINNIAMDKKEKIIKTFEEVGKPLKPGELAEKSGIEKEEVSKLIKEMKTEGLIYSPKRCFYDIKK